MGVEPQPSSGIEHRLSRKLLGQSYPVNGIGSATLCGSSRSFYGLQTLLVPDPRNAFKLIQLVTTVVKANRFYLDNLTGVIQLLGFQPMVKFPSFGRKRGTGQIREKVKEDENGIGDRGCRKFEFGGNSSSSGTNARLVGWRAFSRYPNHQRGRVVAAGCLQ